LKLFVHCRQFFQQGLIPAFKRNVSLAGAVGIGILQQVGCQYPPVLSKLWAFLLPSWVVSSKLK